MAVAYVVEVKQVPMSGKLAIATTKLLGDLFAWLHYMKDSHFVAAAGLAVLLMNLYYLAYCMEEVSRTKKRGPT